MVDRERPNRGVRNRQLYVRLKVGFVVLVAVSAGLIATYAEGSVLDVFGAVASGAVLGVVLIWLAFPSLDSEQQRRVRRR